MLDRLRNNFGLKLLAIGVAVAAWAYLRLTPNPVIAARFVQQVNVPIVTSGLGSDEVAHFSEREAVVSIDVPRGGGAIQTQSVRAVLDLDGRGPGVYNVPIEVIAPKLAIKSLAPASVTLSIERIEQRVLPVDAHYTIGLRRNVVVQSFIVAPTVATLRAPTSNLARVEAVRVDVPLPNTPATLDAMLRPVAIDARGTELPAIPVEPNLVRVRARFIAASHGH